MMPETRSVNLKRNQRRISKDRKIFPDFCRSHHGDHSGAWQYSLSGKRKYRKKYDQLISKLNSENAVQESETEKKKQPTTMPSIPRQNRNS
ncbi:hypothetical protein EJ377_02725 [Chryseobacterium arthrosphaerae]|uniref:Uncharacterized protein n=1 Tax=Chryseobacterium arthrosphaerae TaxID=651561 RepID=A0A432DZ50_9FLAO|nr:hypothetical protein EJ377_02725 [Chryseobacterium arthrosphaerae]